MHSPESAPQHLGRLGKPARAVSAAHSLERFVTAALQGQVKVVTDVGQGGKGRAKVLRHRIRLQRAEPDAHAGNAFGNGFDKLRQATLHGEVFPVGRDLDSRDDELRISFSPEANRFPDGAVRGQGTDGPPRIGDDAVAAEVVAAVLNLEHGPGPPRKPARRKKLKILPYPGVVDCKPACTGGRKAFKLVYKLQPVAAARNKVRAQLLDLCRLICGRQPQTAMNAPGCVRLARRIA